MKLSDTLKAALERKQLTNNHRTVAGTKRARQMQSNYGKKGGVIVPTKAITTSEIGLQRCEDREDDGSMEMG